MPFAVSKRLWVMLPSLASLAFASGCELVPRRASESAYTDRPLGQAVPYSLPASLVFNREIHDQSDVSLQREKKPFTAYANPVSPPADPNPYSTAGLPIAATGAVDPGAQQASFSAAAGEAQAASRARSVSTAPGAVQPKPTSDRSKPASGPTLPLKEISPASRTEVITYPAPEPTWPELTQKLKKIADLRMQQGSSNWALRQRVVAWLEEDAREKSPELTAAAWIAFLHEVSSPLPSYLVFAPSDWSKLSEAMLAIEAAQPLAVRDLEICERVSGYGDYTPMTARTIKPGQPFILYCELSGVRHETLPEGFRSGVHSRIEIVANRDGKDSVVWAKDLGAAEEICQRRRRDYYVNFRLTAPETLVSGSYRLVITEDDIVGGSQTKESIPLEISN